MKIPLIGSRNEAENELCSPSKVVALSVSIYEDQVNWGVINANLHLDQSTFVYPGSDSRNFRENSYLGHDTDNTNLKFLSDRIRFKPGWYVLFTSFNVSVSVRLD
jgi:hypothetical protein